MSAFKFLVDENVGRSVGDYLIEKGHDVAEYAEGRKLISKALALLNGYISYLSHQKVRVTNNG